MIIMNPIKLFYLISCIIITIRMERRVTLCPKSLLISAKKMIILHNKNMIYLQLSIYSHLTSFLQIDEIYIEHGQYVSFSKC